MTSGWKSADTPQALGLARAIKLREGEHVSDLHWQEAHVEQHLQRRDLKLLKVSCNRQHKPGTVELVKLRLRIGDFEAPAYVGRCHHCGLCLYVVDKAILDKLYTRC